MRLFIERLESRLPFSAEGNAYSFDANLDTSGVLGAVSAVADWGNGATSPVTVVSNPTKGPVTVRFDFTYDTSGFFNFPERRQSLQAAADIVFSKFSDQLSAITPSGNNRWTAVFENPTTEATVNLDNLNIAANEIVIFVGTRDLPGNTIALGGSAGISWRGSAAWGQTVTGRGQTGATSASPTDFGPWGGTITVDPTINWHFGTTTDGLERGKFDFLSAVSHEFMHVFGFGLAPSWYRYVSGSNFVGPASSAANGGAVPLAGDASHWREGVQSGGQESLMDPSLNGSGIRKLPTPLDLAGLVDVGWNLITQSARVTGSYVYPDNGTFPVNVTLTGSQAASRTFKIADVGVTNVSPTLAPQTNRTISLGSPISISDLGVFQDPGFGPSETFTYSINWGDSSPLSQGTATIDRAGSPGVTTVGSFDGSHTYTAANNYQVLFRITDDDGGTEERQFTITVLPPPVVRLSIDRSTFAENAGANAASLTIALEGSDTQQDRVIQLSSSDGSELVVPSTVTVIAGQTQVTVGVSAVDDNLLDGTQVAQIIASFGGVQSAPLAVEVLDRERLIVSLNVSRIREDSGPGAAVLRVSRSDRETTTPIQVNLSSSDTSEATLPASINLANGTSQIDVSITAIDDRVLDGPMMATLVAQATGFSSADITITVEDFEPLQWVQPTINLAEGSSNNAAIAEIQLPGPATQATTIFLRPSQANQLGIPTQVTAVVGQSTVQVPISTLNDTNAESPQRILISATANGYVTATITVNVTDDDRSVWTNADNALDVDGSGTVEPFDILLVINYLQRNGSTALPSNKSPLGPPYIDVDGNGIVSPLDILRIINALRAQAS